MNKNKYPLRKIEYVVRGLSDAGYMSTQLVHLECGHEVTVSTATTYRARCYHCPINHDKTEKNYFVKFTDISLLRVRDLFENALYTVSKFLFDIEQKTEFSKDNSDYLRYILSAHMKEGHKSKPVIRFTFKGKFDEKTPVFLIVDIRETLILKRYVNKILRELDNYNNKKDKYI